MDEYQDTNRVQVAILQQLATPDSYLTVVGDDAQSIYSFQGSQVENIRNFAQDFPGPQAVVLNENYRSSPPVVRYVNAVNATCEGALTKTLVSCGPACEVKPKRAVFMKGSQEAEWVVNEIQELMKNEQVPLNEIAARVHLSPTACWKRIQKLESTGFVVPPQGIDAYTKFVKSEIDLWTWSPSRCSISCDRMR